MLDHLSSEPRLPARTIMLGATGFVGSTIYERLRLAGAEALGLGSKELDLTAADASSALRARPREGDALVLVSARQLMLRSLLKAPLGILRPMLVYGARDPHASYGPNRYRRDAARTRRITHFGEGEERRDHVLVDDVAEIALRCLERRSAGVLNVATGISWTFREAAAHRRAGDGVG